MSLNNVRMVIAKVIPYWIRRKIPLQIAPHMYFTGTFDARLFGKKIVKLLHTGYQIENEIYWRGFDGCLEKKSMQIFARIVQHAHPKVVWDIGANSGTYGILTKALQSDCEVVFIEPIPKAVELLRQNLKINNFTAKVFEIAVGDFDGSGEIYFEEGEDFAYSVTVNQNNVQNQEKSTVREIQVRRIDSLIKQYDLSQPDLIKLDVETYEYEVLLGWGSLFPKSAIWLIEILNDSLALKLKEFFPETEYHFWNIDDQESTMRRVDKLGKSDFYNYLIIPKSISKAVESILE